MFIVGESEFGLVVWKPPLDDDGDNTETEAENSSRFKSVKEMRLRSVRGILFRFWGFAFLEARYWDRLLSAGLLGGFEDEGVWEGERLRRVVRRVLVR